MDVLSKSSASERQPVALTIAGSDSGAGAGIQADLKTFCACGIFGCTVLTLITAQNTRAVDAVRVLSPDTVTAQLASVYADFTVAALKTGALGSAEVISAIAAFFSARRPANFVLDPVMISKHGHRLISDGAEETLKRELLPLASVVTPNLEEAASLASLPALHDRQRMLQAAQAIAALGCHGVLVKGGHLSGDPADLLWDGGVAHWLEGRRIASPSTHGTGCTFSAALTAGLAQGLPLLESARQAKAYVAGAIEHAQLFGQGINPVNHFWQTQPRFGAAAAQARKE